MADLAVSSPLSEFSITEAIDALVHYEALIREGNGYRFSHDLVAGYLAAAPLAVDWTQCVDALDASDTDDAWIFAAPFLSEKDERFFLELLNQADPRLMAAAARERGGAALDVAEQLLEEALSEGKRVRHNLAVTGLGIVGTIGALTRLRQICASLDRSRSIHLAKVALARAGDHSLLKHLLPETDRWASLPGASGGDIAVFRSARPDVTLRVARERIRTASQKTPLGMSLEIVGRYGDENDGPSVERIMDTSLVGIKCRSTRDHWT